MDAKSSKSPTHRAYAVTENGGRRFWREIGAAWSHADGDGLNLKLDYLPLNGAEIVLRKPTAQNEPASEGDSPTEPENAARLHIRGKGRTPSPA